MTFPWDRGYRNKPLNPQLYTEQAIGRDKILSHMRFHYSDRAIADDLDAVLDVCVDDEERAAVRAYARARRRAPGFRPGNLHSNNHKNIPTSWSPDQPAPRPVGRPKRKRLPVGRPPTPGPTAVCEYCGTSFEAKRATARFCSEAHKKAAYRSNPVPLTTRKTPPKFGENQGG